MVKTIRKFGGDTEIEKHKFQQYKIFISLENIKRDLINEFI